MDVNCVYCNEILIDDDFFTCLKCAKSVHVSCLKNVPDCGLLLGDTFFDFKCSNCSDSKEEEFKRKKLQW
jgi:hypothetical protein